MLCESRGPRREVPHTGTKCHRVHSPLLPAPGSPFLPRLRAASPPPLPASRVGGHLCHFLACGRVTSISVFVLQCPLSVPVLTPPSPFSPEATSPGVRVPFPSWWGLLLSRGHVPRPRFPVRPESQESGVQHTFHWGGAGGGPAQSNSKSTW